MIDTNPYDHFEVKHLYLSKLEQNLKRLNMCKSRVKNGLNTTYNSHEKLQFYHAVGRFHFV